MMSARSLTRLAALVVCFDVATSTEAEGPLVITRIADAVQAPKNPRGHVHPAVCVTGDGTVLVAHFAEAAKHIYLLRSTDGGRSFLGAGEVPDIGDGHPYPGALTTLADGRIVLTWNSWIAWPDLDRGRRPAFVISDDVGRTWSKPKQLPIEYHREAWIRHRLLERSPNVWIFPIADRVVAYDPQAETISTPFPSLEKFVGPLVRTKTGTLIHGNGLRSTDDGNTWSQVKPFPALNGYRSDLLALDNGWLVAAVAKDVDRFWLNVSYDDGLTWNLSNRCVVYDPGHEIGNGCPQLAILDGDNLGIVFWDHNREQLGGAGVYFARLHFDELRRRTQAAPAARSE